MAASALYDIYKSYLACLNAQDWPCLDRYVAQDVQYNGQALGYAAYRQAREREFRDIPDLYFDARILLADDHTVASRLSFTITPTGHFMGLPVNGRRISFCENVFYEFANGKIARVWSVVDKAAIEEQLCAR